MSTKWTYRFLYVLSFTFQYIVPLVLFGGVIPYTHDGIAAGLTNMGYIAIAIGVLIICGKVEKYSEKISDPLVRTSIQVTFPLGKWILVGFALNWTVDFINKITRYWWQMLIFIIIGLMLRVMASAFVKKEMSDSV